VFANSILILLAKWNYKGVRRFSISKRTENQIKYKVLNLKIT